MPTPLPAPVLPDLSLGRTADMLDLRLPVLSESDEYRTIAHGSSPVVPLSTPEELAEEYPTTPAERTRRVVEGDRSGLPLRFHRRTPSLIPGGEGKL